MIASLVYLLCAATSLVCMVLLAYSYRRTRSQLLLWSSICFVGLALNNALVFLDLAIFPVTVDLSLERQIVSLAGMIVLIGGFIWEDSR